MYMTKLIYIYIYIYIERDIYSHIARALATRRDARACAGVQLAARPVH